MTGIMTLGSVHAGSWLLCFNRAGHQLTAQYLLSMTILHYDVDLVVVGLDSHRNCQQAGREQQEFARHDESHSPVPGRF